MTDAGLEHLVGLTNLADLDLSGTQVSGPGLQHLTGLTKLTKLNLYGTPLTDASVEHLAKLTGLTVLKLGIYSKLTHEGVKKLEHALPNCKFIY